MGAEQPEQIGRYRVVGVLGQGAFGEVLHAVLEGPREFRRDVAIKRIKRRGGPVREKDIVSLMDEARLGALLHHTNIVQTHELGEDDEGWYIAFEFVDGVTLDQLLDELTLHRLSLPLGAALDMAVQICRGVAYAHSLTDVQGRPLGVVHRDLKPANLMLARDGTVKVLDFGLAKARSRERESTADGTIKGSPAYMSPEQVNGGRDVSAAADQFSLSSILFELFRGRKLYKGGSALACMYQVVHEDVDDRLRLLDERLEGLGEILVRAQSKDAQSRWPDLSSMADALERLGLALPKRVGSSELASTLFAMPGCREAVERSTELARISAIWPDGLAGSSSQSLPDLDAPLSRGSQSSESLEDFSTLELLTSGKAQPPPALPRRRLFLRIGLPVLSVFAVAVLALWWSGRLERHEVQAVPATLFGSKMWDPPAPDPEVQARYEAFMSGQGWEVLDLAITAAEHWTQENCEVGDIAKLGADELRGLAISIVWNHRQVLVLTKLTDLYYYRAMRRIRVDGKERGSKEVLEDLERAQALALITLAANSDIQQGLRQGRTMRGLAKLSKKEDVEALSNWAAATLRLAESKGIVSQVSVLPDVVGVYQRIIDIAPEWHQGHGNYGLGAIYCGAPKVIGGDPKLGLQHFERSFAYGGDWLEKKVVYAQYCLTAVGDREGYVDTLKGVLATRVGNGYLTLGNDLAKERAQKLLDEVDERF